MKNNTGLAAIMWILTMLLGALVVLSTVALARTATAAAALEITACRPEISPSQGDRSCPFDDSNGYNPDAPVVLTDGFGFSIVGDATLTSRTRASYRLEVVWQHIETETEHVVLTSTTTWEPGTTPYPEQFFEVPASILAASEAGDDLGRWKLIGRASPVDPISHRPYVWTIVQAFHAERGP